MIVSRSDSISYLFGSAAAYHVTANASSDFVACSRYRHHIVQLVIDSGTPEVIIEASLLVDPNDATQAVDAKAWFPLDTLSSSKKFTRLTNANMTAIRARRADSSTAGVKVVYSGCGDIADN